MPIPKPKINVPVYNQLTGTEPRFSGTSEPNSTVVFYEGGREIGKVVAQSDGTWAWRREVSPGTGNFYYWPPGHHTVQAAIRVGDTEGDRDSVMFRV